MVTKEFLEEQYVKLGKTAKLIGKEIGLSDTQVRYWLRKFEIPIKPRGGRFNTTDISKQSFGELTVLEQVVGNGKHAIWKCRCSCGNVKDIPAPRLKKNDVKSCGQCKEHYAWKGFGELSGQYFSVLKNGAKRRNIIFNVTIEELWSLFLKQERKCAISGVDLFFVRNRTGNTGGDRVQTASLDRIDSSKPYTIDNVQWIHKDINRMKWAWSQDYLIEWARRITYYQDKND